MSKKPSIKTDSKGQMELDGIDTPLGEKADLYIEAVRKLRKATEMVNVAMSNLVIEMRAANLRTLRFKGDTLRYQPGHQTPEKIKFIPSDH